MKRYVVDTGVLLLHLIGDERVKTYFDEVSQGNARASICEINLAEYYYKICEKLGKEIAEIRYHQIRESGLEVVAADEELTKKAGEKKCRYRGRLSLADCFSLALAELKNAILLTTDSELARVRDVKIRYFPV